jgi:hypothetical protein
MSLRATVAYPFRKRGRERVAANDFVVALSLDRDWYSPDQAERLIEVAESRDLLDRDGDDLVVTFDPGAVSIPEDFTPDESLLRSQSVFEELVERLVANGIEKREAVAGINRLQNRLDVTIEAAAVLYARREGLDVTDAADRAIEEL